MRAVENCPLEATSLLYDEACLNIENSNTFSINLFSVSSECFQCDATYWTNVPPQSNLSLVISAVHSLTLTGIKPATHDNKTLCQQTVSFTQHGVYSWDLKDCVVSVVKEGEDAFIPLYIFVAGLASLLVILSCGRCLYHSQRIRRLLTRNPVVIDMQNDLGNPSSSADSLLIQSELVPLRRLNSPRIQALDTFRGLSIAMMIFVNYGGGKYWIFEHAAWNGLTIADLVFPWFAWAMGFSLLLSYRSKLRQSQSRLAALYMSLRRTLRLVGLGLLLNMYGKTDVTTARFCGVLQRLGLAHWVVSTLEILFMKKHPNFQRGKWLRVSELVECWRQWLVVASLAGAQACISLYWPLPDCPRGYLGPGGLYNHSSAPNCTGGVARHVDSIVFGDKHLYAEHVRKVYHTAVPFDPEGILGTLTTCLTVYLGVQAGYIVLSYNSTLQRSARWMLWAVLTGVAAGFLCGWSQEGGLIPVNKQLWSLSFALLTSASAFFLFTVLFLVIDHFRWWSGNPLRHAGMNAILLYVGHIITKNTFPWSWKQQDCTTHAGFFGMNVFAVCLWLAISTVLYNNEIFLTL